MKFFKYPFLTVFMVISFLKSDVSARDVELDPNFPIRQINIFNNIANFEEHQERKTSSFFSALIPVVKYSTIMIGFYYLPDQTLALTFLTSALYNQPLPLNELYRLMERSHPGYREEEI